LKDLSLMVPVSDTTQDFIAAAAGALLDELLDALALGAAPLPPELEPHAAASMATALSPAMLASFALTVASCATAARLPPRITALRTCTTQPYQGGKYRLPPLGCRKVSGDGAAREA
jgi:hypothetical protein